MTSLTKGLSWRRATTTFRFKWKLFLAIVPVILLMSLIFVWFFLNHSYWLLNRAHKEKAASIARDLSYSTELGVATKEISFLRGPIRGALRDEEIAYLTIYGANQKVLVSCVKGPWDLPSAIPPEGQRILAGRETMTERQVQLSETSSATEIFVPVYQQMEGDALWSARKATFHPPEAAAAPGAHRPRSGSKIIGLIRLGVSPERILRQRREMLQSGFALTLFLGAIGTLLSFGLAKVITAPLQRLASGTKELARGNLAHRIYLQTRDEFGELAQEFNGMAGELERFREKIETYNRRLAEEVEHRTKDLERALTDLRRLDQLKDSLMSSVSHELRTPLTSILSFSELLLEQEEMEAETRNEFITIIHDESERLTRLINDILDTAKFRSGKVEWKKQSINLGVTIHRSISAAQGTALRKEVTIVEDVEPELPFIWADPDRIVQVLTNLISNALKFSPETASIDVKAERQDDQVLVSVSDRGEGVPPDQAERIFERFVQSGDILTEKPSGTGLGLTISREIILAHQGEIWVKPNYPVGSIFQFTLPLGKPEEKEPEAGPSESEATASESEVTAPAELPTTETVAMGEMQ